MGRFKRMPLSRLINFSVFALVCVTLFGIMVARNYGHVSDNTQWWAAVIGLSWAGLHIMLEVWLSGHRVESRTGTQQGFDVIVRKKD